MSKSMSNIQNHTHESQQLSPSDIKHNPLALIAEYTCCPATQTIVLHTSKADPNNANSKQIG